MRMHPRFVEAVGLATILKTACGRGFEVRELRNLSLGMAPTASFLGDRRIYSVDDNLQNARLFASALNAEPSMGQGVGHPPQERERP